ncbi:MAG: VWA domain-containing protein [Clostridia bacterium]|nr:VWA domain-containing protein [Clostridia bacterium]
MNINFAPLFAGLNWPPEKPWILLITIPALILGIVPFLRLNKKRRVSSKHLIPFIIHMALILILSTVVAGISYTETKTTIDPNGNVIMFVVDMSDSNAQMKSQMNEHMRDVMEAAKKKEATYPDEAKTKFGLVVFGGGDDGIIKNRTMVAQSMNDPNLTEDQKKNAGKVIEPGGLDPSVTDILYDYEALKSSDVRDRSAIRAGINLALDTMLGEDRHDKTFENSNKRVILLSDGRENVGNVYYALQEFEGSGVALECAYFDYLNSNVVSELQVIGLETKGEAIDGKKYSATVTVNSTSKIRDVTISLKDVVTGNTLVSEDGITVPKGISAHRLTFVAQQYDYTKEFSVPQKYVDAFDEIRGQGIQAIKAEISVKPRVSYECPACSSIWSKSELVGVDKCPSCDVKAISRPDDVLNQNNMYFAWYKFKAQGKILVVQGSANQLSQIDLEALAEKSGYQIDKCETRAFPNTLQKLLEYDEIILMDVNYSELPTGAGANIKRFVEEVGRGLLFTAGENIYTAESSGGTKPMADSKEDDKPTGSYVVDPDIAELLPVDLNLNKEHETIAMVLVVDLSSSMKELVTKSPLICKYCLYEDVDNESPTICPQCYNTAKFVTPTRYQVALSSVKKVIMGEVAPEDQDSADVEINGGTENEGEEKEKKTLQDYDYIGVVAFNQGYHVALDGEMLGDKENREELCEKVQKEFDHFYYAHYGTVSMDEDGNIIEDENGEIVVRDTDFKVSSSDTLTKLSSMAKVKDKNGVTYEWYRVKYTRPEKDTNGDYTGNLVTEEDLFLLEAGGESAYAPGQDDKATGDKIKSHGTAYRPAMQEASALMTRITTKTKIQVKQIVFMSDGAPNDKGSGYEGIVKRLATSGTRTTAIGIGLSSTDSSALEELNIISTAGKGDTFLVDAAKDLDETLFEITDEISKDIRNEKIDAELIADSQDSIVFEGVSDDEGYDTIHGYYATTLRPEASRVFYVDALRPLYAEWEYGLGKVCVLMTDLGNKKWTGSLFDDTDGIVNSRLVQNILLSPIRNRVDSTGLEYSALRDDEQIIVNVTTYANLAERDKKVGKQYFKEKIRATVYVQQTDGDVTLWNTVGIYYASESTGNNHTLVLPTEYTDMTYVVRIEHIKTAWNEDINDPPEIEYAIHGDDPLCDTIAFAIVGQTPEEYNVLLEDQEDKDAGLVLMSSLVTNKNLSDLEDGEGSGDAALKTKIFFTNYAKDNKGNDLDFNSKRVNNFFTRGKDIEETVSKTYNIDIPLVILALILFIIDLIFRNFVIKKRKKKVKEMTDEEQLESMRGR